MSIIKPFKGFRPPVDIVEKLASRPYDVLNSEEARVECEGNPYSLLHVTKAEIDLPKGTDEHSPEVYLQVVKNYNLFKDLGWLVKDEEEKLYIYAQSMNPKDANAKWQYGIVACAYSEDYVNKVIKKHELTRKDKEEDRMKHVRITNANVEPVFFAYPAVARIDEIVAGITAKKPIYDFIAKEDGFGHRFWVIDDKATIAELVELFDKKVPAMYIADGHHRSAAAALVGQEKKEQNPKHTGKEEYNFFMTVIFPDNQLNIIDYNRVVKDLNGLSKEQFIAAVSESYDVQDMGTDIYKPTKLHEFSMYLDGHWYKMTAKPGTFDDSDPIGRRRYPWPRRVETSRRQRRDEGRLRPLSRLDEADHRHRRHRQHYASEDHLVRAQAPLRPRDPRALLNLHQHILTNRPLPSYGSGLFV